MVMGEIQDKLASAMRRLLDQYDPEAGNIYAAPEPSCLDCTMGVTPAHMDKGPCPYHQAVRALRDHDDQSESDQCPSCRRPVAEVAYGGSCHRGGCPLGGDL
jgi:hypothetical protein